MKITIVIFKAFDKICNEAFINGEEFEAIHEKLSDICETYVPLHIIVAEDSEPVSLNILNQFKK